MDYYLVFQNKSYKEEHLGGYLWAPQKDKNGLGKFHWKTVSEVQSGDSILHSYNQKIVAISNALNNGHEEERPLELKERGTWDNNGWKVDLQYHEIENPMITTNFKDDMIELQPTHHAPFNRKGTGNQGYLFRINKELYEFTVKKTIEIQRSEREKIYIKRFLELENKSSEILSDEELIEDVRGSKLYKSKTPFEYLGVPKQKENAEFIDNRKLYKRNKNTAINSLRHAEFQCEIAFEHPTFLRKKDSIPYTEPHHLIPMSFSDKFDVSLDVEENIVSLCSNCHNQLHYGQGGEELLFKLYSQRNELLKSAGIVISFIELKELYNI